ncbi:uncharacterized protein LOC129607668 [Condylostylus longicornis]|uniref:uncharacterized protein LOC129607668 n=1 Tax=Condylostylus longicornis TaxID=2530218 RepID=UPI00244DF625|nr:uncharacterized protein LOC129607668 [Condylostylus longicornis]
MNPCIKITNRKQFECLVACMAENVYLARNVMPNKDDYRKIWKSISDKLNSLGSPIKTMSEWQKVWTDMKLKVRKKIGVNKKELKATGGGLNKLYEFTSLEEEIVRILQLDKVANSGGEIFGLEEDVQRDISSEMVTEIIDISSSNNESLFEMLADQMLSNVTANVLTEVEDYNNKSNKNINDDKLMVSLKMIVL